MFSRCFRGFCVEKGFGTYGKREDVVDAAGRKRVKRTKYEGLSFHELRHTQATLLIGSGADIKTVQTRLGHSSAQLTMNTYAHAIEANDRNAADAIGEALSGRRRMAASRTNSAIRHSLVTGKVNDNCR